MIDAYFSPSYFKKISVPRPAHCFDTVHIVAPVPQRNRPIPNFVHEDYLLKLRHDPYLFSNGDCVSLGFNPHSATGLSEQDSSEDDMDLSSHALKPDWWEGDFQERFCEINPDVAPFPQRPPTPFYSPPIFNQPGRSS